VQKIVLFYKKLIEPGGAERLLVNEYIQFKSLGYEVDIVAFKIEDMALFDEDISDDSKIILGDANWILSIVNFINYIRKNKKAVYLCASGHIEIYIASLFTNIEYSLHIHHPSFMSFNETDKYSIFQRKYFKSMLQSNFGAIRFKKILQNMSLARYFYINLKAYISIKAIRGSKNTFVLSKYAKNEKKILFNISSNVICGALDDCIFECIPVEKNAKYHKYKNKILSIARLDENKRLDELLKAFKFFLLIEPSSILLIGGKGPELKNLKDLSKSLNIEKKVKFLGFIPENEIFDLYAIADLFVSIDWADYRITMYESLAMNTKVLLSNETDSDKFLLKSKYLFVTQPDSKSTAKALELALNEKPNIEYSELKEYLRSFTWYSYCKKIAKILFQDK
jgi:glycosyltransferase involved in cell wall biosynthesis